MFTTRSKLTAVLVALLAISGSNAQYRTFVPRDASATTATTTTTPSATTPATTTPTVTTTTPTITTTPTTTTTTNTNTATAVPTVTIASKQTITPTPVVTATKQIIPVAAAVVPTATVAAAVNVTVLNNSAKCEMQYGSTDNTAQQICSNDGKLYSSLSAAKCTAATNTAVVLTCVANESKCGQRCADYVKKTTGNCKNAVAGTVSVCANDGNMYASAFQMFCVSNKLKMVFPCYANMTQTDCQAKCIKNSMTAVATKVAVASKTA